jgi:hypothetical protein
MAVLGRVVGVLGIGASDELLFPEVDDAELTKLACGNQDLRRWGRNDRPVVEEFPDVIRMVV